MQGRPVSDFVLSLSLSSLVHLCVRVCVCVCVCFTAFSLLSFLLDLQTLTWDCALDTQSSCATSRRPSIASTTAKNDRQ